MSVVMIGDHQLSRLLSHTEAVQDELDKSLRKAEEKAKADLAAHHHSGDARIETDRGQVDRFLILSDERGLKAAMTIEYGRKPGPDGKGGMAGLKILHKAFGLESG